MPEYLISQSNGDLFVRQLSRALTAFAALGTKGEGAPILEGMEHPPSVLEPHALFVGNRTGEEDMDQFPEFIGKTVANVDLVPIGWRYPTGSKGPCSSTISATGIERQPVSDMFLWSVRVSRS